MKRVWIPATATLLIGAGLAFAQEAPEEHPMNPIAATLVQPEVLAAEQTRLKLTEGQRESIQAIAVQAHTELVGLEWAAQAKWGEITALLAAHPVDEAAVLSLLDEVAALEKKKTRAELVHLIQIKNTLSREQIALLPR